MLSSRFVCCTGLVLVLFGVADAYTYETDTGMRAAMFSSLAYAKIENLNSWSGFPNTDCTTFAPGFTLTHTFSNESMESQAFIGVDDVEKQIIIAYRGSANLQNWVENLDSGLYYKDECIIEGVSVGNAHAGFCEYVQSLEAVGMGDAVNRLHNTYPGYQVFMTGHSLGASGAAIAAAYQGLMYPSFNPLVYTLGEPRSGDHTFVNKFAEAGATSFRITHHNDPVPHLSFCCLGCKAEDTCPYHQGSAIYYGEDMGDGASFTACDPGEDSRCNSGGWTSINDHLHYFNIEVGDHCY